MNENEIGKLTVDSAVHLHQNLGPGLLGTSYEVTQAEKSQGLSLEHQVSISIEYEGQRFHEGF